jgi:hypothetical protein
MRTLISIFSVDANGCTVKSSGPSGELNNALQTSTLLPGSRVFTSYSRHVVRPPEKRARGSRIGHGVHQEAGGAYQKSVAKPDPGLSHRGIGTSARPTGSDFVRLERRTSTLPYPHRHDYYQIVWVVAGSGFHVIDSVSYPVRRDSVFFISPRQIHDFQLSAEMTGYTLNFSAEFFYFGQKDRNSMTDFDFSVPRTRCDCMSPTAIYPMRHELPPG